MATLTEADIKAEPVPDLAGEQVLAEATPTYVLRGARGVAVGTGVHGPNFLIKNAPFRFYVFPRTFASVRRVPGIPRLCSLFCSCGGVGDSSVLSNVLLFL